MCEWLREAWRGGFGAVQWTGGSRLLHGVLAVLPAAELYMSVDTNAKLPNLPLNVAHYGLQRIPAFGFDVHMTRLSDSLQLPGKAYPGIGAAFHITYARYKQFTAHSFFLGCLSTSVVANNAIACMFASAGIGFPSSPN